MKRSKNTDASQKEDGLKDQKLVRFKSPPKDSSDQNTKLGKDTPASTTQGYSEDHMIPDPKDKTVKRTLGNPEN